MGTPDFAVPALHALIEAGHEIVCAYSQPPRPAGRGKALRASPVQQAAEAARIPVRHPKRLKDTATQAAFAALEADIAVVAAYGLILPAPVLAAPRLGCVNIHASLLPRWRGAAPIQRAIMAGDRETGVCLMKMDTGLDTGPVLACEAIAIGTTETAGSLHDRLAAAGAAMLPDCLSAYAAGALVPKPQPDEGVTYAAKLTRADEEIDWSRPADAIARQVRALNPRPGARFTVGGESWKLLAAQVEPAAQGPSPPGCLIDDRLGVACGDGRVLRALQVQRPGRKPMPADAALRGAPLASGTRLA